MFKYLNILSREDKIKVVLMLVIGLMSSLLEALGIGLIIPLVVVLIEPDKSFDNQFIDNFLGFVNDLNLLTLNNLIILLLFVFILKNVILFIFIYLQGKFSSKLNKNLSELFFKNFFLKKYNFFLAENSQSVITDIQSGIGIFSQKYISPLMSLILEVILVGILFTILFFTNPKLSLLAIFILSLLAFTFLNFFKKRIKFNGEETQLSLRKKYNLLNEIYYNIKDIKVFVKENLYIDKFNQLLLKFYKLELFHIIISQTPKLLIEISAMSLILGFLYFSHNYYGVEMKIIFIQLTVFAAIVYRMVPSYNRIMFNNQMIRFSLPFCKNLYEKYLDLEIHKSNEVKNIINDNIGKIDKIEFKNISFYYPKNKKKVLDNLCFELNLKKITGLKGSTGTGKTSLLDILIGLLDPSSGKVIINDQFDINHHLNLWKKKVGYIPQKANLFNGSIKENITFFDKNPDKLKIDEVLKLCLIDDLLDRDDMEISAISETGKGLSGGQLQKIAIARALYVKPDLLILDEATNSLDLESEKKILRNLSMLGNMKILMISHHMQSLEYCDEIFELNDNTLKKIK